MELINKYINEYSVVYKKEMIVDSNTEILDAGESFKSNISIFNIYGAYLRKKIKLILPEGLAVGEGTSEIMYTNSYGPTNITLQILPTCMAGRVSFTCRVLEDRV